MIAALQGCVIVVLQGCVIVVLQGCVIVLLRARLRDCLQGCNPNNKVIIRACGAKKRMFLQNFFPDMTL
jgi:hypothetical protein